MREPSRRREPAARTSRPKAGSSAASRPAAPRAAVKGDAKPRASQRAPSKTAGTRAGAKAKSPAKPSSTRAISAPASSESSIEDLLSLVLPISSDELLRRARSTPPLGHKAPPSREPPRRSARAGDEAARRAHVVSVAEALFAAHGPARTSVTDVCRAARISQSTFHGLFGSKEHLVDAIGQKRRAEAEPVVKPILQQMIPVREKISLLLDAYLRRLSEQWSTVAAMQIELLSETVHNPELQMLIRTRRREMNHVVRELVRKGQRDGEIDPSLDADAVVEVLGSLFLGMQVARVLEPTFSQAPYTAAATALVMGSFWRER